MASSDRRRRVSYSQLEALWEFLNSHRDLAVGYNKSSQAREYSRRMWMTAYWIDYKARIKKRAAATRATLSHTGGGPSEVIPLSEVEKKILSLLGDDFGAGLSSVQVDPFPELANPHESEAVEGLSNTSHEVSVPDRTVPPEAPEVIPSEALISPGILPPGVSGTSPHVLTEMVASGSGVQLDQAAGARRRERPRRQAPMTREVARRALVESAQARVEIERRNSATLEGILNALERISQVLESRLPLRSDE